MVFRKFVQIGRVALVNYGPDLGKLCTIIDVIDENRVLVDGPCTVTGVHRQAIPLKWVVLTKHVITIPHSCCSQRLVRAFEKAKVAQKFNRSRWAAKIRMHNAKLQLTDFDRFKLMRAKQRVNQSVCILGKQMLNHFYAKRTKAHMAKINKENEKVAKLKAEQKAKRDEERTKKAEAAPKKEKKPEKAKAPEPEKKKVTPPKRTTAEKKAALRAKKLAQKKAKQAQAKKAPAKRKILLPTAAITKRKPVEKKPAAEKKPEDKEKKPEAAEKKEKKEKKPVAKKAEKKPAATKKPAAKKEEAAKPQ